MAHYAFIDPKTNLVTEVITGIDETELIEGLEPEIWYGNYRGQKCLRTSYNNKIRKQFAGIGYTYDHMRDEFVAPQPFESWTLDENNDWQPPTPKPDNEHYWDENLLMWVKYDKQKN